MVLLRKSGGIYLSGAIANQQEDKAYLAEKSLQNQYLSCIHLVYQDVRIRERVSGEKQKISADYEMLKG